MVTQNFQKDSVAQAKDLLRFSIRRNRMIAQRTKSDQSALFSQHIAHQIAARKSYLQKDTLSIAAFLPVGSEPPILDALTSAHEAGHKILVPVVLPQRQLGWVNWSPTVAFTRNALGIMEPVGERHSAQAFMAADLRLIPALAYDISGRRLGQGGGYYDRLLSPLDFQAERTVNHGQISSLGVVFDREVLDGLPYNRWDTVLYHVITENGVHDL